MVSRGDSLPGEQYLRETALPLRLPQPVTARLWDSEFRPKRFRNRQDRHLGSRQLSRGNSGRRYPSRVFRVSLSVCTESLSLSRHLPSCSCLSPDSL